MTLRLVFVLLAIPVFARGAPFFRGAPAKRQAPVLDFTPRSPRSFALLSGLIEAAAAVNQFGEVVSLTDDGVLSLTKSDGYARWSVLVGPSRGAPALDDQGVTYVAGRDQQLYAVDPDGRLAWVRNLHARPHGGVLVTPTAAIVAFEDGVVAWYSREQGTLLGSLPTGIIPSVAPILLHDGWMIIGSTEGDILKVDNRGIRWRRNLGANLSIGSLAPDGHGALIANLGDGSVAKIGVDGAIAWRVQAAVSANRSPVFSASGQLLLAARSRVLALDAASGAVQWKAETGGHIVGGPLVADDGTVYVSVIKRPPTPEFAVVAVNSTGEVAARMTLPAAPVPGLTLAEHRLWVGLRDGTLRTLEVPQRGLARSPWAKSRGGLTNSGASRGSAGLGKLEPE